MHTAVIILLVAFKTAANPHDYGGYDPDLDPHPRTCDHLSTYNQTICVLPPTTTIAAHYSTEEAALSIADCYLQCLDKVQ